ncbi:hypothetical protein FOZ61_002717 [Perkinsus olseni]|uniref:Uncharacterized protein n=1 Tax=Perkinsus olseni TaxID=32597 RepID=A0A7J6LSG4_PEROL|nr:hypothetical protein FOL46_006892 [Perkinsus olseni]KAF4662086.1 hypothetical protein FOZ61_002717 [Perkinsus olseni]
MPASKHITIRASAAAVIFTSTLPLGDAANNTFPSQMKATLFQPSPGIEIAICTYSEGDENSDTRSEFQVFLDKTIGIQTSYITCPKTDRRRAFTADFNTDYQNPQIRSVQPYGDAKFKFGQLPVGQGVDPLSNHMSILREIFETKIFLPRGLASANGKALTRACPYVGEAIEKEFGPFSDVCRKYFVLSKEAKVYAKPKVVTVDADGKYTSTSVKK